jgi:hypothetical protein
VDVGVGVSNGAVRTVVIPMVHDFIITGASSVFGSPSNILIRVTSSSYNVLVASTNQLKMIIQVPPTGFMH